MKRISMVGSSYGFLTILSEQGKRCEARCSCGSTKTFLRSNVLAGKSLSCGCLQKQQTSQANTKHGHARNDAAKTPTYRSWQAMWTRCRNPNRHSSHRYTDRGITADRAWQSFTQFLADMGERPEGTELDRINNDAGYSKKNCRWITHKENCNNRNSR